VNRARSWGTARRAAAATLLATAALAGCATSETASTDPCAVAVDRLTNECNFEVTGFEPGAELNCTGSSACVADCLFSSPCADIKNESPAFITCIKACE
jgi:nitrous oxide reductase accessory protein NosL